MAGEMLDQMASGFAPVASGYQPQMRTGFEGAPFVSQHPLLGMLAQPMLMQMMGGVGMVPTGLGHDQNVYDTLKHRSFNAQQRQAMANVSSLDRESMMRTFRGMAAMSGVSYGAEQRRAAGQMADMMQFAAPMLAQMAPDVLDQMGGQRGSAVVMANRMMQAGRYQIDPATGRLGVSADSMGRMAQDTFRDLYGTRRGVMDMSGITAGQAGALYENMVQRGMVGVGSGTMQDRARSVIGGMSQQELHQAASRQNVVLPGRGGAGAISAEDIDKLSLDPGVADKLRSFDGDRVKRAIKSYSGAVAAMRDIFGDMGRPNAPMGQLMQSLEAMSMGSLSQMDPERAGRAVRNTYNIARNTGVSMDNAMLMQQHAATKAAQLGMEPVFAIQATQGGLSFGGAYRGLGLGQHRAWGAMNADQLQQADVNLRVGASSSNAANRLAVAMRLSETHGGFQEGSEAANIVNAVRGGFTTYQNERGEIKNLGSLQQPDFFRILSNAKGRDGQQLGIRENDVREMMAQRFDNREVIEREGIGNTVRNMQGQHQVTPFLAQKLTETLTMRLSEAGVDRKVAHDSMRQVSGRAMQRIMSMSTEDFSSEQTRNERIGAILEEELSGTEAGGALERMRPEEKEAFMRQSAARFYGRANEGIRSSGYRGLGNLQNVHRLFDRNTLQTADNERQRANFESQMQEALAPLGRGTALSRTMDAVQNAKPGDDMRAVIGAALGGVKGEDINARIAAPMQALNTKMEAIKSLQADIQRAPAGQPRQDMERRLQSMLREARSEAADVAKTAQDFGFFGEGSITARDTQQAMNTQRAVAQQITDVGNIRGGFGLETSREDLGRAKESYNASNYRATPAEAAAVLIARRRRLAGEIREEDLNHAATQMRQQNPQMTMDEAREEARKNITAYRMQNAANLTNEQVAQEMRSGKVQSDEEARALVLVRRQQTALRPTDQQVSSTLAEMRRQDPRATEDQARDLATARQRARRWGISDEEVYQIKEAGRGRGINEQQAIATAVEARERAQFQVTREQIEYAKQANPSLAGRTDDEVREAVIGERNRQKGARFERFWQSEDGQRFRDNVEQQTEHANTTAERLVTNQEVVKRFGTQAIDMHRALRDIQQRRRVLAFRYTGGDVARLMAGDYSAQNEEEHLRIQRELHSMHGSEQEIYKQIHETHGQVGRQFRVATRDQAIASLRAQGNYREDAPEQEREGAIMRERERMGSVDEAVRIMGLTPEQGTKLLTAKDADLTPQEKEQKRQLQQRTMDVAVARRMTGQDEQAVKQFGERDQAIQRLAQRHGTSVRELMRVVVHGQSLGGTVEYSQQEQRVIDDAKRLNLGTAEGRRAAEQTDEGRAALVAFNNLRTQKGGLSEADALAGRRPASEINYSDAEKRVVAQAEAMNLGSEEGRRRAMQSDAGKRALADFDALRMRRGGISYGEALSGRYDDKIAGTEEEKTQAHAAMSQADSARVEKRRVQGQIQEVTQQLRTERDPTKRVQLQEQLTQLRGREQEMDRTERDRTRSATEIAGRSGVTAREMVEDRRSDRKLTTLSGEEKDRRDSAVRDYEAAQRDQRSADNQSRSLERSIANLDRQLARPTITQREREQLEARKTEASRRLEESRGRSDDARRRISVAEDSVNADARRRGVSGAEYIQGRGFLTPAERDRVLTEAARQGQSVEQIQEMAKRIGVRPEDLANVTRNVIEPQTRMAEEYRRRATASGMENVEEMARTFGVQGFSRDDNKAKELAQKLGTTPEGRQWAQYMTWTERQLGDEAKNLRGGGGVQGLSQRWQAAMGERTAEGRQRALSQLQTDLGIDTSTNAGKQRWEKLTESLDFQKRAGLLEGRESGRMNMDRIAQAYDRIRQGGELRRPDQAGGQQGVPSNIQVQGRLYIDGRVADLNARTGGGSVGTVAPPP